MRKMHVKSVGLLSIWVNYSPKKFFIIVVGLANSPEPRPFHSRMRNGASV